MVYVVMEVRWSAVGMAQSEQMEVSMSTRKCVNNKPRRVQPLIHAQGHGSVPMTNCTVPITTLPNL